MSEQHNKFKCIHNVAQLKTLRCFFSHLHGVNERGIKRHLMKASKGAPCHLLPLFCASHAPHAVHAEQLNCRNLLSNREAASAIQRKARIAT